MQFITSFFKIAAILLCVEQLHAQAVFLPQNNKHATFLDRLQIKMQSNSDLNVSNIKPFDRRMITAVAEQADSLANAGELQLSEVDRYNLQSVLANNMEWVSGDRSALRSKKSVWNTFYTNKADFFQVDEKDFFLSVNPVIQQQQSIENNNDQRIFLNTRGIAIRGLIAKKVGFYTYLTENLERAPLFVQDRTNEFLAIPGAGRYNIYKNTGWDYSDARAGITFNAAKYLDFQFAYDRNFIGNGYRSLFLSDFGNNYLFLKVNTKVWKLNYQNIFMELNPQFGADIRGRDLLLDKKYAAIHHLSINATKWLNLGLFEAVVFGRKNHFDFMYLNPIIFLRTAEKQLNSPDNGMVGFDAKANIGKRAQLYGHIIFDELIIKELTGGNGWWGNKFGIQMGGKYIDFLGVKNLDIQGEVNLVRPYTYTHYDSSANYTHYNQPMAHPLGANFVEAIGIVKYQPLPRLTTSARLIYWKQGVDTGDSNYGSNIFKLYDTRSADYGVTLPFGVPVKGLNAQLLASYELKENLYVDASLLVRRLEQQRTTMLTLGLRLNMFRKEYDY